MKIRIKFTNCNGLTMNLTKTAYPIATTGDRELWSSRDFGKFTIAAADRVAARSGVRVDAMPATEAEIADAETNLLNLGSSVAQCDALDAITN